MDLDHLAATDQEIVNWCQIYQLNPSNYSANNRLLGTHTSNVVLRLNNRAVVKFGYLVTPSEAANQRLAYEHLNCQWLRIPQVYRFFQASSLPDNAWRGKCGYLVMELIQGTKLSEVPPDEIPQHCHKVARAITAMSLVKSDRPGPADGGEPHGNIWAPDYRAYESFKTTVELEAWFNRAPIKEATQIHFPADSLGLCHLDLCRRNILLVGDGSLAVLDWASAGFYPRAIQLWSINTEIEDYLFVDSLLEKLPELSADEKSTVELLGRAYFWNSLNGL